MEIFDVAVAGAGVAGCLAARDLAKAGYKVAIIERNHGAELGHDWWDTVKRDVFAEVGMPAPKQPELMIGDRVNKVYPPLETVAIEVQSPPDLLSIDRKHLAQRQLNYALEAGARLMDRTAVKGPVIRDGKIRGLILRSQETEEIRELEARLVIDATGILGGVRSRIPEQYGFQNHVEPEGTFVTYREIRANTTSNRESMFVFGKDNGVRWISRTHEGLVDFFAGLIDLPQRLNPKDIVDTLISSTQDAGPEAVRGGVGGLIPVRHCFDSFVAPGLMLCGDSACQCNPMDGSGIASSLRAASMAAKVACNALQNQTLDVETLWSYNVAYKRSQGAKFVVLDAMQKFMVPEAKANLETLFTRKIIVAEDFWGTGVVKTDHGFSVLIKVLKLMDRPRFILRLSKALSTAMALGDHYMDYPEEFDPHSFQAWRDKKLQLFDRIKTMYPRHYSLTKNNLVPNGVRE